MPEILEVPPQFPLADCNHSGDTELLIPTVEAAEKLLVFTNQLGFVDVEASCKEYIKAAPLYQGLQFACHLIKPFMSRIRHGILTSLSSTISQSPS